MFEMIADAADGALASLRTAGIAAVRTVNVERRWPEPWLSSLCMPQSTIHETRRDELSLLGKAAVRRAAAGMPWPRNSDFRLRTFRRAKGVACGLICVSVEEVRPQEKRQVLEMAEQEFSGTKRFRVLSKLGAGGMGVVYRVHDSERGRDVALKTLQRFAPSELYYLKNEFRALADVAHPNLVTLYELISEGDQWFFTMELVEGVDFRAWVWRKESGEAARTSVQHSPSPPTNETLLTSRTLSWPAHSERSFALPGPRRECDFARLRPALLQLAIGVNEIHKSGRLHRDIKPSNVLVTREGRVVLLDFGLAIERRRVDPGQSIGEALVGTPAYMSPEQTTRGRLGPESDWYGVGALLYEVLTGSPPFGGTLLEVVEAKWLRDPMRPGKLAGVPADLDSLCMGLLQRSPQDRPTGKEVLARLGGSVTAGERDRAPRSVFIGRRAELEALASAYAKSCKGAALTVHVHGASGMGKTALVEHFLEGVRGDPRATVLAGRCYERETVPYKALDSLIDSLARYLRHLGHNADALLPRDVRPLVRLFPVLQRAETVANAPIPASAESPDPHEQKRRAFASLKELLARIADRGPLVLWIDDLQWGDVDSAALLADLVRPPDAPAALIVLTYRTDDGARSPCVLAMRAQAPDGLRELQVQPLQDDDARELANALLPAADAVRAAQVAREAAGNPLFVAELVEQGHSAPASFEEMLLARTARLEPEPRRLLEVISVAGGPIDAGCAFRAAAAENAFGALAILRTGRLARGSGDNLEAYHDRIRETVVKHLDGARIREVHAALAAALEGWGGADPEVLATHLHAAGELARTAEYAIRAARAAAEALAFDRASRLYRLALELTAPDAPARLQIQIDLATSLANAGRGREAGEAFLAAAEASGASQALDFRRRAAEQYLQSGHLSEGMAVLRIVLESIGMRMPATPQGALISLLLGRAKIRLRGLSYRERDAAAIDPRELLRIDVCRSAMTGLSFIDVIHGADFTARLTLLALRGGEPLRVGVALTLEAIHVATAGGSARQRAERILQIARSIADRIGQSYLTGMVDLSQGTIAFLDGRWQQARRYCDRAAELLRDQCTGVAWELDAARLYAIGSCFRLGETGEIMRRLTPQLEDAQFRGDLFAMTMLRTGHSNIAWLAADQAEEARHQGRLARGQWSYAGFQLQHWNMLLGEASVDLYAGEGRRAWDRMRASWPAFRRSMLPRIAYARATMVLMRGASALAAAEESRDPSAAKTFLGDAEHAADDLERGRIAALRPTGLLLRAGVEAMRRKSDRALSLLEEAAQGFDAAEMALCAAAARRRHGQLAGGDAGRAEVQSADVWMSAQQIRNPERMTRMLAPGFGS